MRSHALTFLYDARLCFPQVGAVGVQPELGIPGVYVTERRMQQCAVTHDGQSVPEMTLGLAQAVG